MRESAGGKRRAQVCLLGALVLAVIAPGCRRSAASDPLGLFEEDFFPVLFEHRPTLGASCGLHRYDGRLDDLSPLEIGNRVSDLNSFLGRLQRLEQLKLTALDSACVRQAEAWIRAEIQRVSEHGIWRTHPEAYFELAIGELARLKEAAYATPAQRLGAVVGLLNELPGLLAAMRGNVGSVTPEGQERALQLARKLHAALQGELADWAREAAGVDVALIEEYRAAASQAGKELELAIDWLNQRALEPSRANALGPRFEPWLRQELGVEMPLEELEKLAAASFQASARRYSKGVAAGRPSELKPTGQSPKPAAPLSPAERMAEARRALGQVTASGLVQRLFPDAEPPVPAWRLTRTTLVIDGRPVFCLLPGPLAPHEEPPVWLTPTEFHDTAPWAGTLAGVRLQLVRDLYPGSWYWERQLTRQRRMIPKVMACPVMKAGWPLYVVELLVGENYWATEPEVARAAALHLMLADAMWFGALKFHRGHWTLQQLVEWLHTSVELEADTARSQAVLIARQPQVMLPGLGRALILQLWERYRSSTHRSRADFHSALITHAGLRIRDLERLILPGD